MTFHRQPIPQPAEVVALSGGAVPLNLNHPYVGWRRRSRSHPIGRGEIVEPVGEVEEEEVVIAGEVGTPAEDAEVKRRHLGVVGGVGCWSKTIEGSAVIISLPVGAPALATRLPRPDQTPATAACTAQ
jgi:hypothetical protein